MALLRRLLGGADRAEAPASEPLDTDAADAAEREHELELMREEQDRLDDLTLRQQRYAGYAWRPPDEGGERRADDQDAEPGKDRA